MVGIKRATKEEMKTRRKCKQCYKLIEVYRALSAVFCTPQCKSLWRNTKRHDKYKEDTGYEIKISGGQQGTLSETRVIADLLARGYMVFPNCSHFGSIDLIFTATGPNQPALRVEVKTVERLDLIPTNPYQLGVHFDHFALVKRNGEIRYEPELKRDIDENV